MLLSIIICNNNYARYLRSAINSALAIDWLEKEIIVVDDGSTDESRELMEQYGDEIDPIFKENGGQISAANLGFARSRGEVVIFLDSDDLLLPTVGKAVMAVWSPNVAKVQFGQYHIDEANRSLGTSYPNFTKKHTPEWIRRTFTRTSFYDTAPTSGNAWSRKFLERVFPMPCHDRGRDRAHSGMFDDYLSILAPFFGDIVCLTTPQGKYRKHTSNKSGITGRFSPERVARICEDETLRVDTANRFLANVKPGAAVNFERYWEHMYHRLIYRRLLSEHYPYEGGLFVTSSKFLYSVLIGNLSLWSRGMLAIWGILMMITPRQTAYELARLKSERERRLWQVIKSLCLSRKTV